MAEIRIICIIYIILFIQLSLGWGLSKTFLRVHNDIEGLPKASGTYLRYRCTTCKTCFIVFKKQNDGTFCYSARWSNLEHFQRPRQQREVVESNYVNDMQTKLVGGVEGPPSFQHKWPNTSVKAYNTILPASLAPSFHSLASSLSPSSSFQTKERMMISDCFGVFDPPTAILPKIPSFLEMVHTSQKWQCVLDPSMN